MLEISLLCFAVSSSVFVFSSLLPFFFGRFANSLLVSCGWAAFRFLGELFFHTKIDGTTSSFVFVFPARVVL